MRRIGRLAFLCALFAGLAGPLAHAQQTQTQMFAPPTLHGVLLDWCAHFGRDCGKPAADLFCREQHFDQATCFSIDQNAGQRGIPTLVFGDGSLCQGAQCSGFRQITCARAVAAQPETPRTFVAPPPTIAAPPPVGHTRKRRRGHRRHRPSCSRCGRSRRRRRFPPLRPRRR